MFCMVPFEEDGLQFNGTLSFCSTSLRKTGIAGFFYGWASRRRRRPDGKSGAPKAVAP